MLKTILFLPLLLLAGCPKEAPQTRADNDSPIIISDTPTLPLSGTPTSETTVTRGLHNHLLFGLSLHGFVYVHDRDNGQDLKPGCLVLPSGTIVPLDKAKKWKVSFQDANSELSIAWGSAADQDAEGDIMMHPLGLKASTDMKKISHPVQMTKMTWDTGGPP